MSNSNKIIVVAISVTVALCLVVIGVASVINSGEQPDATVVATESATYETVPTVAPDLSTSGQTAQAGATSQNDETVTASTAVPSSAAASTSAATSTTQSSEQLSSLIIGKWMDSAGMSGFEFSEDGKVSFTYVNLSSLGVPFDGTARNGIYTIEGNIVTIKFSIYTATIDKEYEASIENDVLTMRDVEEKETSTYTRQAQSGSESASTGSNSTTVPPTTYPPVTTTAPGTTAQASTLDGKYLSGDRKTEITFNADGTVDLKIKRDDFSGVYQVTGNKLVLVYIDDGKSVSEEYDFTLNGNILTLTSSKGESEAYIKQ